MERVYQKPLACVVNLHCVQQPRPHIGMKLSPRMKTWRFYSLAILSAAALTACGGGSGDSGGSSNPQSSSCSAAAPGGTQGERLIAKLRSHAQVSPASVVRQSATGGSINLGPGLKLLKVSQLSAAPDNPLSPRSSASKESAAAPVRYASIQVTEPGLSMSTAMQRLRDTGLVDHVEPDAPMRRYAVPNDPFYTNAWHLRNTGQFGTPAGPDIGAESAWNINTGSGNTVVAVIDDGLHISHPDLSPNLWRNPREVAGNGIDDDGNGIVDDVHGADMVLGIGDVRPYFPRENSDHGTNVAGIIAGQGANNEGATGVLWNTQVMAMKIKGPASTGYSLCLSDFVDAFNYALTQKAVGVNVRVINVSYGTSADSASYREVINAAGAQGILVVVAAGNDSRSDAAALGFPTNWALPNVLSVGAFNARGARASFSNFGSLVNIYAPGQDLLTTSSFATQLADGSLFAPNYRWVDGTSFAAPAVSGAAALLMDAYPSASMSAVRARLLSTAVAFGTPTAGVTQKRLNLGAAMAASP